MKRKYLQFKVLAVILAFLTVALLPQSQPAYAGTPWRSSLYPSNWTPGYKDVQGRFLQDFSYAGYHMGETGIPTNPPGSTYDVTQSPYNADKTGVNEATSAIQAAINAAGAAGGGIVYLPAGTYRVKPQAGKNYSLLISKSNVVLRGAGSGSTFIFNDEPVMRGKRIIDISPSETDINWYPATELNPVSITSDLVEMDKVIPVASVSGYSVGDWICLRVDFTAGFIADLNMTGKWTAGSLNGIVFYRQIKAIDTANKKITIDIPVRYWMKTRDNARIYKLPTAHLSETGVEDLAIGNRENLTTGLADYDYSVSGTGAYEMHNSFAIYINHVVNGWVKNVKTYKPSVNTTKDVHTLSNVLRTYMSRNITIESCNFQKPEYEGAGGNGYLYRINGQEDLIKNSTGYHGRHNYDIGEMQTSGNVFTGCTTSGGRYTSDFHMHFSPANLFDNMTVTANQIEAVNRSEFGTIPHGQTTTQSVIWNTNGTSYMNGQTSIVKSQQFGWGYVIGTRGAASAVSTLSGDGCDPVDFVEGVGTSADLVPQSLYADQLSKRLGGGTPTPTPTPAATPTPTPASALIGYWRLDETSGSTAVDSSGNGYNGTLTNGPVWTAGEVNNCLEFDGTDDYVELNNPAGLQITGPMTLAAWVYVDSFADNGRIVSKQGASSDRGWSLNVESGGYAAFQVASNTSTLVSVASSTLSTGTWYHLAGVYEPGSSLKMYVNGTLNNTNTTSIPSSQFNSDNNVNIGRRPGDGVLLFDGKIDEVRVYNAALSASEVAALAQLTPTPTPPGAYPIIYDKSSEDPTTPATNLLDGNTSDDYRWSASGFPQWAIIDYGSNKTITGTNLWTYQSRAYQYKVWASTSLSDYENEVSGALVVDRSGNTSSNQPIADTFSAKTARYVKIKVTGAYGYSGSWVSLNEFGIVEGTGTTPTPEPTATPTPEATPTPIPNSINSIADAFVRDGSYAGDNYGTSAALTVKDSTTSGFSRRTYLKFDISSFSTIVSAKLRAYGSNTQDTSTVSVKCYSVTDDSWTESGITWSNKPANTGNILSSASINNVAQYYEFDVTAFVQSQLSGDKIVTLELEETGNENIAVDINSKEAADNRPQLSIIQ